MKKRQLKQKIACRGGMLILVVLFSAQSRAQFAVGIEGGFNKNYLITNVSNLVSTQYNSLPGFGVSLPLQYSFADWFAVKVTPGYAQKNYQLQRTGFYQGVYQNNTNGYVQLPVMGHFSFGSEKLRGFVDMGGYAGYWLTAHIKGVMPNILDQPAFTNTTSNQQPNNVFDEYTPYSYNEKYQFNTTKDNRLELGVLAGAGISYQLNTTYQLYAEAAYYDALTDQQKKYETGQVPRYNQTYSFNVGVLFSIGKKGH